MTPIKVCPGCLSNGIEIGAVSPGMNIIITLPTECDICELDQVYDCDTAVGYWFGHLGD